MKNIQEELREEYDNLCATFGVKKGGWHMLYENYHWAIFCPANRRSIIAQYLIWEEFVERAKKHHFTYYYGIDDFLREYRKAVYGCLTNLE